MARFTVGTVSLTLTRLLMSSLNSTIALRQGRELLLSTQSQSLPTSKFVRKIFVGHSHLFRSEFSMPIPEKTAIFHGRHEELSLIISSIKSGLEAGKPARIAIRGGVGMGKTSLALSAIHHKDVQRIYEERIYYLSCEAITTASLLIFCINRVFKIPAGDAEPVVQLKGFIKLIKQPTLLFLDNFETP